MDLLFVYMRNFILQRAKQKNSCLVENLTILWLVEKSL